MTRKHLTAALCLAAALATGACSASVSVGGKQVAPEKVAAQMSSQLAVVVGKAPDDVTGTVTSVDGDNVEFDVEVASTPNN